MWVGKGSADIYKGVYLTLCLRHTVISQIKVNQSLELSNGRCPGCDCITAMCVMRRAVYLHYYREHCLSMRNSGKSYRRGL